MFDLLPVLFNKHVLPINTPYQLISTHANLTINTPKQHSYPPFPPAIDGIATMDNMCAGVGYD